MMKLWIVAFGVVVLHANSLFGQQACDPLQESKLLQLSKYVQTRYRLPFLVSAPREGAVEISATCYRKIRFESADAGAHSFALTLYLSPDQRFLSKDLFDLATDPLLEERQRKQAISLSLLKNPGPSLGQKDAQLTLTIFSDFQCPYCKKEAAILRREILPIEKDVRIIFRYLPLPMHDWSRTAADAAACVANQGEEAFWVVHDYLFDHQESLRPETVINEVDNYLSSLPHFDRSLFKQCIENGSGAKAVDSDLILARDLEVTSTPTLFINGTKMMGVMSSEQTKTLIRQVKAVDESLSIKALR